MLRAPATFSDLIDNFPAVQGGEGSYVVDSTGACCLDCTGVAPVGHGHPRILAAAVAQLQTLHAAVSPARTTDLVNQLLSHLTPSSCSQGFLFTTIEQALDAAAALAARRTGRGEIVLLTTGLAGRTQLELSTTGLPSWRTSATPVQCVHHVRFGDIAALSDLLGRRAGHIAAVVAEPIATNSLTIPPATYWRIVRQMTEQAGVLLGFDESHTALLRTGHWLAAERWDVTPDFTLLGPSLASGLPLAALLCGDDLAGDFTQTSPANPVAIAAAEAMLDVLSDPALAARVREVGDRLLTTLHRLADRNPHLSAPRSVGLLIGVDVSDPDYLLESLRDHGVLATLTANTLVLHPPLTISDAEVTQLTDALYACL